MKQRMTSFMAIAFALISAFEGLRLVSYKDATGIPTVCYGETRDIDASKTYSKGECDGLLEKSIVEAREILKRCSNGVILKDYQQAAFVSFIYNVGSGAFCGGSVSRYLRANEIDKACKAMEKYKYIGKRISGGLVKRRRQEVATCLGSY